MVDIKQDQPFGKIPRAAFARASSAVISAAFLLLARAGKMASYTVMFRSVR